MRTFLWFFIYGFFPPCFLNLLYTKSIHEYIDDILLDVLNEPLRENIYPSTFLIINSKDRCIYRSSFIKIFLFNISFSSKSNK